MQHFTRVEECGIVSPPLGFRPILKRTSKGNVIILNFNEIGPIFLFCPDPCYLDRGIRVFPPLPLYPITPYLEKLRQILGFLVDGGFSSINNRLAPLVNI